MATIVCVHGVGQQFRGEHTLKQEWLPALRDGLLRAGADLRSEEELRCVFYGDVFRKKVKKSVSLPPYAANDVDDEFEQELLLKLWQAVAAEENLPGPGAQTKAAAPRVVQRALNVLSRSAFFAEVAERALIFNLKQVRIYFDDPRCRQEVQSRVEGAITADARVMVAHSLGSVVAYEALCAHPTWPITTFVTLGSPLGIRHLIFGRKLVPAPQDGIGAWPGGVERWFNIADGGDPVALEKRLDPLFAGTVRDQLIYNGARAHDVSPYLTAAETGRAIATGF